MSSFIFGRHDSDRHDVYFSVLNQAHISLVQICHRVNRELGTLSNGDQESDDFDADIVSALKDVSDARAKLGSAIAKHRHLMGW